MLQSSMAFTLTESIEKIAFSRLTVRTASITLGNLMKFMCALALTLPTMRNIKRDGKRRRCDDATSDFEDDDDDKKIEDGACVSVCPCVCHMMTKFIVRAGACAYRTISVYRIFGEVSGQMCKMFHRFSMLLFSF